MVGRRLLRSPGVVPTLTFVTAIALAQVRSSAQLARPLVLRDARLLTMTGPPIEKGTLIVKGDRIDQLGAEVEAPFLSRTIDVSGKVITPGLIDAWSALGHSGAAAKNEALAKAWDAFDQYARDDFREALRHGVTTVFLSPGSGPGVTGIGVAIHLLPQSGGAAGERAGEDLFLCLNLGSEESPIARAKTFLEIRKLFRKAVEYRDALEDYEEELKEYLKKIEERAKKEAGEKSKKEGEKPPDKVKEAGEKKGKDAPPKDEKGSEHRDAASPDGADPGSVTSLTSLFSAAFDEPVAADEPKERPREHAPSGDDKKPGEGKKEDELKKPAKPAPDRVSELLLRAIDRKLAVRVQAHRSADLFNAIELAREFHLDFVLEGATEGYLLADSLADANVPVILGPTSRVRAVEEAEFRRHCAGNAEALKAAGVDWTAASGATDSYAARFISINAAAATRFEDDATAWLRKVTVDAARMLRLHDQVGTLARGKYANLVVWSGDPNDATSVVERVYVGGKLAYLAPHLADRRGGS